MNRKSQTNSTKTPSKQAPVANAQKIVKSDESDETVLSDEDLQKVSGGPIECYMKI